VASKIDMILEVLSDGEWHSLYELQYLVKLTEKQIQKITSFLSEFDFVHVDLEKGRVTTTQNFQILLT
jgi:hypothetical protein